MHWRNSRFQVVYFLVGKTHTPDEAYRVLCELREERSMSLNSVKAIDLRARAKLAAANKVLNDTGSDEVARLNAEADIAEVEANKANGQSCIDEAQRELQFLDEMIARIQPHRVYKDYPDHEAHQLAQREEWRYELLTRAENYIGSQGYVPAEHYATMRMHPDWESSIAPYMAQLLQARGKPPIAAIAKPMEKLMLEVTKDIKLLT